MGISFFVKMKRSFNPLMLIFFALFVYVVYCFFAYKDTRMYRVIGLEKRMTEQAELEMLKKQAQEKLKREELGF